MKRRVVVCLIFFLVFWAGPASWARADSVGLIARGLTRTIGAAFSIPKAILRDSARVMFPFGIVTGAITGTVETVGGILEGGVDIVRGAAPYAKYAIFFI